MKFSALFLCVFISVTASANSFDTPVRDLLADYLNTKDATKVSEAMMRCAALISLTNAMAQDVPNTIRIILRHCIICSRTPSARSNRE